MGPKNSWEFVKQGIALFEKIFANVTLSHTRSGKNDRRVQMTTRDVTNGKGHGQHGKGKGDAKKTNTYLRKGRHQDCTAASAKH